MFLTVHAAAGAAIGENINDPIMAFILGFVSHFIIDAVPHGDEHLVYAPHDLPAIKKQLKYVEADSSLVIILTALAFGFKIYNNPLSAAFGVFGAVLPDMLVGLYELSNLRHWQKIFFRRFCRFHHFCHNRLIPWQPKQKIGYSIQAAAFMALLIILL